MGSGKMTKVLCAAVAAGFFVAGIGCQSTPRTRPAPVEVRRTDPLKVAQGADLERNAEVQLVEQMARDRSAYRQDLQQLRQFYDRQGSQMKVTWVEDELKHLDQGPKRAYLVVAEIAGPDLRATKGVVEADTLYRDGVQITKEAGSGLFVDNKKLYLAIDKFDELITNYPTSDKIGDAAFQLGEIYNKYLRDYTTALLYYQRVWQWDPQTPLPARFEVARIYDEKLFDHAKALQFYEQAINLESAYSSNVVYSKNRVAAIQKELGR
jgi:TolA-binding protein